MPNQKKALPPKDDEQWWQPIEEEYQGQLESASMEDTLKIRRITKPAKKNHLSPIKKAKTARLKKNTPIKQAMAAQSTKSMGISIILTTLFGPIGLFYATVKGGFVMLAVTLIGGTATLGIGLILIWPGCILWGATAVSDYNERLLKQQ